MKEHPQPEMTRHLNTIYEYGPKKRDAADKARYLVRIWDTGTTSVVVLTELPDNPGMSVTNACEGIASRAVQDFDIDPQRTIFRLSTRPLNQITFKRQHEACEQWWL